MNESWYNNVFFNCNVKHIIVFFNIFQKAPDWSKRGLSRHSCMYNYEKIIKNDVMRIFNKLSLDSKFLKKHFS